ncbi:MAG: hypothetical protein GF330_12980 [Candidatus Eisenbacteria bacterium]|nr:hypothetical protein [Candidatus Eisenbacteria bacterium]
MDARDGPRTHPGEIRRTLERGVRRALLKKLGLTPQKPLRRAYQQDPERVQQWIAKDYPKIKAMAKREGALILFGDEAGVAHRKIQPDFGAPGDQTSGFARPKATLGTLSSRPIKPAIPSPPAHRPST